MRVRDFCHPCKSLHPLVNAGLRLKPNNNFGQSILDDPLPLRLAIEVLTLLARTQAKVNSYKNSY